MTSDVVGPVFVSAYADCCRKIVSGDERAYDGASELMSVIADPNELPKLPGSVYAMWGELTDACEGRGEETCRYAEELMREAASEFLALADPRRQLASWAEDWMQRITSDERLRA